MRPAFFTLLLGLLLVIGCDEKDATTAAQSDAGVQFDRVSPTPHDVTRSNRKLRELKKGMQEQADDREKRIEDKINP